jgi:hypothetical protein
MKALNSLLSCGKISIQSCKNNDKNIIDNKSKFYIIFNLKDISF